MSLREMAFKALKIAEEALLIATGTQSHVAASAALTHTTVNSATVAANATITTPATADLPTESATPASFLVSAAAFVRHSAVDHQMTAQLVEDPAGAVTLFGPQLTFDSSHVNANGAIAIPSVKRTPPPGAVRKYALLITNGTAGTVTILAANESSVTVQPLG